MIEPNHDVRLRRLRAIVVAIVIGSPMLAGTIGVGGAGAALTAHTSESATGKACTKVADALADGPDPDVDPVGYALAQVRPLRAITTSDKALRTDIVNLADAFETVYKTNDKKGSQSVVNSAGKKLDAICAATF